MVFHSLDLAGNNVVKVQDLEQAIMNHRTDEQPQTIVNDDLGGPSNENE